MSRKWTCCIPVLSCRPGVEVAEPEDARATGEAQPLRLRDALAVVFGVEMRS
jgi:hypothetical protein